MFTTIPMPKDVQHGLNLGQPIPEIIDHRQQGSWDVRCSTGQEEGHKTYDSIKQQLEQSITAEKTLKRRNKELEKENEKLLEVYESTNTENSILKSHMKHGPNSQKIKQLQKDVKELKNELENKQEENQMLADRIKELERSDITKKDLYLEKNWRKAIELGKLRREEKDAKVGTQGPFKEANSKKKKINDVSAESFESLDSRDLQIDSLEKGTLILLNKIRLLKQNKEDIDYANFIDKGAITRNKTIKDAINDKLDRDLESFATRLDALQKKAKIMKINTGTGSTESHACMTTSQSNTTEGKKSIKQTNEETSSVVQSDNDEVDKNVSTKRKKEENKNDSSTTRKASMSSKTHVGDKIKSASVDLSQNTKTKKEAKDKTTRSVTPDDVLRSGSPIVNHWDQLAEKLIRTEKYGGIKSGRQLNHRNSKTSNNGQPSTHSYTARRVSSTKTSNSFVPDNLKGNRTTDISSPISNYSERSNNSVSSKKLNETDSKPFDTAYQPQTIRFVSTHQGFEKRPSERYKNGPESMNIQNPVRATVKAKTESKEQVKKAIQPKVLENDIEEETRDVSAYDAILTDLQKQHEVHEKAQRTTSVSRQQIHVKTLKNRELYNGQDNRVENKMPFSTELKYDNSSRTYNAHSRLSTRTLELL